MARRYKDTSLRDPETGEWDKVEVRHRIKGALAVLVSLAILGTGGWFVSGKVGEAWNAFRTAEDYIGAEGEADIEITVPAGASINQVANLLKSKDVVRTPRAFQEAAAAKPDEAKKLQAGRHKMRTKISGAAALDMLLDPKRIVRDFIQLREGMRMELQIEQLAKVTKIPVADFQAVLADPSKLGLPDWAGNKPEGFLFPDTYEIPANPTAEAILANAVKQFNKVAADLDLEERAAELGITPMQAVVIASIMEREVSRDEDRPKVSRVIFNRLKVGMPLQLDSTVAYAANSTGTIWTTEGERNSDSPYNTYKHKGLPPGPISSPARKALEAALNPADGDWLFFMPQNLDTGETVFTNSGDEHYRAVARFKEWCNATPENKKKCG